MSYTIKAFLLLAVLLGLSVHAPAQWGSPGANAARTRLVSQASLHYDGSSYVVSDSTIYRYDDGRTGYYDPVNEQWIWDYDTARPKLAYWLGRQMSDKRYDQDGNCISERVYWWNTDSINWVRQYEVYYSYNESHDVATMLQMTRDIYTGSMDTDLLLRYSYTSDKKVSRISARAMSVAPDDTLVTHFVYNAAGDRQFTYTERGYAAAGVTVPESGVVYTYDASGDRTSQTAIWWTGTSWDSSERLTYSDITDHMPGTVVRQVKDTVFKNVDRGHHTYNAYGMPVFSYYEWWNGSWQTDTFTRAVRYHYEELPDNVASHPVRDVAFGVHPVPASDELTVSVNSPEDPYAVSITDMLGREQLRLDMPGGGQALTKIPVGALAPGNYLLTVFTAGGAGTKQVTIAR